MAFAFRVALLLFSRLHLLLRSIESTRCCSTHRCFRAVLRSVNRPLPERCGHDFDAHRGRHQRTSHCGGRQDAPCAASSAATASSPVLSVAHCPGVSCGLPSVDHNMCAPCSDTLSRALSVRPGWALLATDDDLRMTSTWAPVVWTGASPTHSVHHVCAPAARVLYCSPHAGCTSISFCRADSKRVWPCVRTKLSSQRVKDCLHPKDSQAREPHLVTTEKAVVHSTTANASRTGCADSRNMPRSSDLHRLRAVHTLIHNHARRVCKMYHQPPPQTHPSPPVTAEAREALQASESPRVPPTTQSNSNRSPDLTGPAWRQLPCPSRPKSKPRKNRTTPAPALEPSASRNPATTRARSPASRDDPAAATALVTAIRRRPLATSR